MKNLYGLIVLSLIFTSVSAQDPDQPEIDIQQFIAQFFQVPDQDVNYDDLYESLYQRYSNPINLNQTSKTELLTLPQLSIIQVDQLWEYLEANAPLLSIFELQVIDGFDASTIETLRPFVVVTSPGDAGQNGSLWQRISKEDNNYLLLRTERTLQKRVGYSAPDSLGYLGSPYKIYGRYRTSHSNDFSLGFTFEQDPGEPMAFQSNQHQYGFDYYSIHLFLQEKGKFKSIALGDYQMQFGQGLILGAGFNPGKGAETINTVKRSSTGLRPYTSVLESGFMRGAAFTYQLGSFDFSPFYSLSHRDGAVQLGDSLDQFSEYVSAIQYLGLHRTQSEIDKKNQIREQNFGMNISYKYHRVADFQAGITYLHTDYSTSIYKTPTNYNQFEFKGNQNSNLGVFANLNWQNFLFFSETAVSSSRGTAIVAGAIASLSPIVSMSFVTRNYDKSYHSFYGNAFGESARIINEKGMYWGIKIEPNKKLLLTAYYDYFEFPWLKFRTEAPSVGHEYLTRITYRLNKKVSVYGQFREQEKQLTNSVDGDNIKTLITAQKRQVVGGLDLGLSEFVQLKTRLQYSTYDAFANQSSGIAIVQDINLEWKTIRLSGRYALFDTDNYENRQYVYEKDLLYAFAMPAYSGQGVRSYLMMSYKPTRKLTFWLKYGRYDYRNVNNIGTGLNQIDAPTLSEIKFQMRIKF